MTDTAKLAAALVAAQAELPAVEPNATNPHYKSQFVTLDHLIARTLPVLNRHGLAMVQLPSIGPAGEPALTTVILHVSGERLTQQMLLMASRQDPQGQGAALTYARRYAWAAALGISAEEDKDGNDAVPRDVEPQFDPPSRPEPNSGRIPDEFRTMPTRPAPPPPDPRPADAKPATDPQKKKMDVLVGQLRDQGGYVTTMQLYYAVGQLRGDVGVQRVALAVDGYDENGELHWAPLRESLTRAEARDLIDRLEAYQQRAGKAPKEEPT